MGTSKDVQDTIRAISSRHMVSKGIWKGIYTYSKVSLTIYRLP